MIDWDAILGAQQDDIARQRYEMLKLVEQHEAFRDCKSEFDVLCKLVELSGEGRMRPVIANMAKSSRPWLTDEEVELQTERLLRTFKNRNREDYDKWTQEPFGSFGPKT